MYEDSKTAKTVTMNNIIHSKRLLSNNILVGIAITQDKRLTFNE